MAKQFRVSSEVGTLRRVITHHPDEGIARVNPKRSDELLFDDIVHLPTMQKEHDVFVDVLRAFVGEEGVLNTQQLILEALGNDKESRAMLIDLLIDFEELPKAYKGMLADMDNETLSKVLITGYDNDDEMVFFDPIPNFIFTRDIAVMINDHCVITKAAKSARHRENLLTRFFMWAHPLFNEMKEGGRLINLNDLEKYPPSKTGEKVSIEGGDMMILNEENVLIGTSERSTDHAFHSLKNTLFAQDVIDNVVQVVIPNERSFMHIDTLFTQVNTDLFVAFKPIIVDGLSSYVKVHSKNGTNRTYPSVKEYILSELNPKADFVLAGMGKSPYQEREQWTDGCNLLTVKPGVALGYDRNPWTDKAFMEKGYSILPAKELLNQVADGRDVNEIEQTIITLPSGELSRARGGSHCMSCPLDRASV